MTTPSFQLPESLAYIFHVYDHPALYQLFQYQIEHLPEQALMSVALLHIKDNSPY